MTDERTGTPNHLDGQTSPYLLQHLYNPVDWYPWGPEALDLAQREDRPIFLSIGYAACHWCHVMERESFEDPAVGRLLAEHFVCIKVDREERPDIDAIYMNAIQLMTGQGGWPLNVFLTPDGRPFFGGTYFPPEDRHGHPAFTSVLHRLVEAWKTRRDDIERSAGTLLEHLRQIADGSPGDGTDEPIGPREASVAAARLAGRHDPRWGGFGQAPKFPPDGALALLLREHARTGEGIPLEMVTRTLDAMALGGMYDQAGGGFARYSVDERWLVPHFEKMLYNQALLVPVYVEAWQRTGHPRYRRVVEETLDFVARELTDPDGGFWSSLDADSEGEEGLFYVWTPDQLAEALEELPADERAAFAADYDVTPRGNFEGRSILHLTARGLEGLDDVEARVARWADARRRLMDARADRVRPGTDDKVLTAWNGLMITALCRAWQAFGRSGDLDAARRAMNFVDRELTRDGRLLASWRRGQAHLPGYLDDHAFLLRARIDLYECTFDPDDLRAARRLADVLCRHFVDARGGFWFTADDHEALLTRQRSTHDGALPSGSGVAVEALLRLWLHLDESEWREVAERALAAEAPLVRREPSAFASLLCAADYAVDGRVQLAITGPAGPERDTLLGELHRRFVPARALAVAIGPDGDSALLRDRPPVEGRPTAYLCVGTRCEAPVTSAARLGALLDALPTARRP